MNRAEPSAPSGTVLAVSTAALDRHDTGRGHPERAARVVAAAEGIADAHAQDAAVVVELDARPATRAELARVHDERHLDVIEQLCGAGGGYLDPDTSASPGSFETAILAAGGGLNALEALRAGTGVAAFVAARPPGHHATRDRAQGFCLFNNVAVTAAAIADAGERVLVVDWDVHHGNGTQDIFWDDPRVMYVSTHQWPLYPGTGRAEETGGPNAAGLTINVPLPPGSTGDVALVALHEVVAPAVERFAPDWVLASAGYDAHRDDPLASLAWSAGDYLAIARLVAAFAPRHGRVVAFLEGGYDIAAVRRSVTATVAGLTGATLETEAPTTGGPGREAVVRVAEAMRRLT